MQSPCWGKTHKGRNHFGHTVYMYFPLFLKYSVFLIRKVLIAFHWYEKKKLSYFRGDKSKPLDRSALKPMSCWRRAVAHRRHPSVSLCCSHRHESAREHLTQQNSPLCLNCDSDNAEPPRTSHLAICSFLAPCSVLSLFMALWARAWYGLPAKDAIFPMWRPPGPPFSFRGGEGEGFYFTLDPPPAGCAWRALCVKLVKCGI